MSTRPDPERSGGGVEGGGGSGGGGGGNASTRAIFDGAQYSERLLAEIITTDGGCQPLQLRRTQYQLLQKYIYRYVPPYSTGCDFFVRFSNPTCLPFKEVGYGCGTTAAPYERAYLPQKRRVCAWHGGSMLACLSCQKLVVWVCCDRGTVPFFWASRCISAFGGRLLKLRRYRMSTIVSLEVWVCCDRGYCTFFFGQPLCFCLWGQATQTEALPNINHSTAGGMDVLR